MRRKTTKTMLKTAAAMLAVLAMTATPYMADEEESNPAQVVNEEPPAPAPEPEPAPAPEPEPAPAPEPEPAPAPEPEPTPEPAPAPEPETSAPAPAPAPETSAPAPAENSSSSEGSTEVEDATYENHSTAIPENPKEKRINVHVVDAHETDGSEEGILVSAGTEEGKTFDFEASFDEILSYVAGISGRKAEIYFKDVGLKREFDSASNGTASAVFARTKARPSGTMRIVVGADGSDARWFDVTVDGTLEEKNAVMIVTPANERRNLTITFDAGSGTLSGNGSITRRKGEAYGDFGATAESPDGTFCGWYEGKSPNIRKVMPTDRPARDATLTAYYSKYGVETMTFDLGFIPGGESESISVQVTYPKRNDGTFDLNETPIPRRDGYSFEGWYDESGSPAVLEGRTEAGRLTAKWSEKAPDENESRIYDLARETIPSYSEF